MVEAKVTTPGAAITVPGGALARPSHPIWSIRVGETWTAGFPASYDDTEGQVWAEVKRRVDRILDEGPPSGV